MREAGENVQGVFGALLLNRGESLKLRKITPRIADNQMEITFLFDKVADAEAVVMINNRTTTAAEFAKPMARSVHPQSSSSPFFKTNAPRNNRARQNIASTNHSDGETADSDDEAHRHPPPPNPHPPPPPRHVEVETQAPPHVPPKNVERTAEPPQKKRPGRPPKSASTKQANVVAQPLPPPPSPKKQLGRQPRSEGEIPPPSRAHPPITEAIFVAPPKRRGRPPKSAAKKAPFLTHPTNEAIVTEPPKNRRGRPRKQSAPSKQKAQPSEPKSQQVSNNSEPIELLDSAPSTPNRSAIDKKNKKKVEAAKTTEASGEDGDEPEEEEEEESDGGEYTDPNSDGGEGSEGEGEEEEETEGGDGVEEPIVEIGDGEEDEPNSGSGTTAAATLDIVTSNGAVTTIVLSMDSYKTLSTTGSWLDGDVINFGIQAVIHRQLKVHPELFHHIDSLATMNYIKASYNAFVAKKPLDKSVLNRLKLNSDPDNVRFHVMPITLVPLEELNDSPALHAAGVGTHWFAIVVLEFRSPIKTRVLYVLDSFPGANKPLRKFYIEHIIKAVADSSAISIVDNVEQWIMTVPKQSNGYDCGVHLLSNVRALLYALEKLIVSKGNIEVTMQECLDVANDIELYKAGSQTRDDWASFLREQNGDEDAKPSHPNGK